MTVGSVARAGCKQNMRWHYSARWAPICVGIDDRIEIPCHSQRILVGRMGAYGS